MPDLHFSVVYKPSKAYSKVKAWTLDSSPGFGISEPRGGVRLWKRVDAADAADRSGWVWP